MHEGTYVICMHEGTYVICMHEGTNVCMRVQMYA